MKSFFFASLGKLWRLLSNRRKLKLFSIYFLRYPLLCTRVTPSFEHLDVIRSLKPDLVLDVGFNKGQFAALCSIIFKNTPILGFDPLKYSIYPYVNFMRNYLGSRFDFMNCALSNRNTFEIMKESISSDSSSLFTPSDYNLTLYPSASPRGSNFYVIEAKFSDIVDISKSKKSLLKIDVQGYEHNVLKGISETQFKSIKWIYLELSDMNMYCGQKTRKDIHEFLLGKGYFLSKTANKYFNEYKDLIYCDCLYTRTNSLL